jgi:hypothetical protein
MRKVTSEEYHQRFMASPGIWRSTITIARIAEWKTALRTRRSWFLQF